MSGWTEADVAEPNDDQFDRPFIGITAGGAVRVGDAFTLTFEEEPTVEETDDGDKVRADVTIEETDVRFPTDGDPLTGGDEARLSTSSARFLNALKAHAPVAGGTYVVTIEGTGYDAAYSIEEA